MTITFFSNFLNDHQLPFCHALIDIIGDNNFHFVAHERIDPERIAMGFKDMNEIYPFVVKVYNGRDSLNFAQRLMLESDVVIIGSCHNMPFTERMDLGKLTFRYNERILKKGDLYWFDPRMQLYVYRSWVKYRNGNLFELCASAYTARDLSLFGFPKNKCFKWGYFPVVKEYDNIEKMLLSKREIGSLNCVQYVSILWVSRFIEWKHPEVPVMIAKRLKEAGYAFKLDMIGIGKKKKWVESLIVDNEVSDCVHILGGMPPSDVRRYMEQSEIFLFTSDKNEGWGAVLNESMNSGCAVIANEAIGSVPFLIKDGENGFIYKDGNVNDLYCKVKLLMDKPTLRNQMGRKAYETITKHWNARNAVSNLMKLIDKLNNKQGQFVDDGPCSKC